MERRSSAQGVMAHDNVYLHIRLCVNAFALVVLSFPVYYMDFRVHIKNTIITCAIV